MKDMQSSRKIASVTKGFSSSPSGGTAMPMNTSAAIARVPWPPSHASACTGRAALFCSVKGMWLSTGAGGRDKGFVEHVKAALRNANMNMQQPPRSEK